MLGYNEYMIPKIVPHLLTYPRSGMNYFSDILYEEEQINFSKSHYVEELFDKNNVKTRKIITISRDPIDSISSYLALYNGHGLRPDGHEHIVKEKITEYVLMYSFLCEHADYVVDFNHLIENPKAVIKKILNLLDIDKNEYKFFDRTFIPKHESFISSSRSLPKYRRYILGKYDLDLCYYYYNKLLAKKIII